MPVVESSPAALAVSAARAAYVQLAAPVSPQELPAFPFALSAPAANAVSVAYAVPEQLLRGEPSVVLVSPAAFSSCFFLPARKRLRKRRSSSPLMRTFL